MKRSLPAKAQKRPPSGLFVFLEQTETRLGEARAGGVRLVVQGHKLSNTQSSATANVSSGCRRQYNLHGEVEMREEDSL